MFFFFLFLFLFACTLTLLTDRLASLPLSVTVASTAAPPASATGPAPPLASSSPTKRPTVAQQFITRTAAAGISINARFLLGFVHILIKYPALRDRILFNTRLLTEQAAERLFRAV